MERGAAFAVAIAMAVFAMTTTTTTAQQFSEDEKAVFVLLHNNARAAVGVGPVAWNDALAAQAMEHARYCQTQHIPGPYGENLWWSYGAGTTGTPANAMAYWLAEKDHYYHDSNYCSSGELGCAHYTQVVWSRTAYVGCARVACNTAEIGTIIACNYYPRGNMKMRAPTSGVRS